MLTPADIAAAIEQICHRMSRRSAAQAADAQALAVLVRQLRGEPANDVAIDVDDIRTQALGLALDGGEL